MNHRYNRSYFIGSMLTVFAAITTAGCRSPTAGTHGACPEVSQIESAIDLASALYAEPLCHDEPVSQVGACIQEVVDLGSVLIGEHQARVLIVRRRIVGMASPRGMATVEVLSPSVNRIASFRIDDASKIQLEVTGLLRIGNLPPIPLQELVGFDTAPDLIAKSNAAEWSRQAVAAVMDVYAARGLEPLLSEPLPILLQTSAHTYWYQGLSNAHVIEPSRSSALFNENISLPQQIHRYMPQELSANDISAPPLRYSKYWESTVRVQVWEDNHTQTPVILEFAVQGNPLDSDLVESIRLVRVLK